MLDQATYRELDSVIGLVYDSALDPAIWPKALEATCRLLDGCHASLNVMDPTRRELRLAAEWCPDPEWPYWRRLLEEKYAAMMPFYGSMHQCDVDQVYNTAMMAETIGMAPAEVYDHPFFQEWALPSGRRDTLGCVVMKSHNRFGFLNVHTSTSRDLVGPRELAIGALLVPHVRRAVHIGDVLGATAARVDNLQVMLDMIAAAVVVTDAGARVIMANRAAEDLLDDGGLLMIKDGRVQANHAIAGQALHDAIALTTAGASIGSSGIGVPLFGSDGRPAIAHVLPLAQRSMTRDWGSVATAAVFIAPADSAPPDREVLMALFGLTPMEVRVLLEVAGGKRRAEAAAALGISENTAKTHLNRVYVKTATSDQAELARLVDSLRPPVRRYD